MLSVATEIEQMIQQIQYCSGEGNRGRVEEIENEVCGGKDEGRETEMGGKRRWTGRGGEKYRDLDLLHNRVDVEDSTVASTDDGLVFQDHNLGIKLLSHMART